MTKTHSTSSARGTITPYYEEYSRERFVHYYQQIDEVLKLSPDYMLEVGPGDNMVGSFLRMTGIQVETIDIGLGSNPTYNLDIREPLNISREYDLVLASEVLEHMDMKWLGVVARNLASVLKPNGWLVISVPYSTWKLWRTDRNSAFITYAGRIPTYLPVFIPRTVFWPVRALVWLLKGRSIGSIRSMNRMPDFPDEEVEAHRWDVGAYSSALNQLRGAFGELFDIIDEKRFVETNSMFLVMRKNNSAK